MVHNHKGGEITEPRRLRERVDLQLDPRGHHPTSRARDDPQHAFRHGRILPLQEVEAGDIPSAHGGWVTPHL